MNEMTGANNVIPIPFFKFVAHPSSPINQCNCQADKKLFHIPYLATPIEITYLLDVTNKDLVDHVKTMFCVNYPHPHLVYFLHSWSTLSPSKIGWCC